MGIGRSSINGGVRNHWIDGIYGIFDDFNSDVMGRVMSWDSMEHHLDFRI